MPTISFIVTAQGKLRMQKALEELYPQLERGDEVIIVADKNMQPYASNRAALQAQLLTPAPNIVTTFAVSGESKEMRRCEGAGLAKCDYFMFLDQFDFLAPDALKNIIRPRLAGKTLVFQVFDDVQRTKIWKDREIKDGNINPMMLCVPAQEFNYWPSDVEVFQEIERQKGLTWIRESIGVANRRPSVPRNLTSSISSNDSHRVVDQPS